MSHDEERAKEVRFYMVRDRARRHWLNPLVERSVGLGEVLHKALPELLGKTDNNALRPAYVG